MAPPENSAAAAASDSPAPPHRVLITGTGRAGTTFLVRLLTELGLDTGYTRDSWRRDFSEHTHAGLEKDPLDPASPYIVKRPIFANQLGDAIATGRLIVDHVLIPVRDLDSAARSRIRLGPELPGGLTETDDPARQREMLTRRMYALVHALAVWQLPHTFLDFPRIVRDPDYTYDRLAFLLGGLDRATFRAAFDRVAEPALVHDYAAAPSDPPVDQTVVASHWRTQRARGRRRRLASAALFVALGLALGLLASFYR